MLHPRELLWRSKFHIFLSSLWHQDLLGQEVSPGFFSLLDNFMGGLGMKQVSLAASCIPGEAKHLLAHSYSSTEVPDQKDLLWHWVCSVGIEGTWVKCNCSSYSFQCVQCDCIMLQFQAWVSSSDPWTSTKVLSTMSYCQKCCSLRKRCEKTPISSFWGCIFLFIRKIHVFWSSTNRFQLSYIWANLCYMVC